MYPIAVLLCGSESDDEAAKIVEISWILCYHCTWSVNSWLGHRPKGFFTGVGKLGHIVPLDNINSSDSELEKKNSLIRILKPTNFNHAAALNNNIGGTMFKSSKLLTGLAAFCTLGDGYHANHHNRPQSARHGNLETDFDLAHCILKGMEKCGLGKVNLASEIEEHHESDLIHKKN